MIEGDTDGEYWTGCAAEWEEPWWLDLPSYLYDDSKEGAAAPEESGPQALRPEADAEVPQSTRGSAGIAQPTVGSATQPSYPKFYMDPKYATTISSMYNEWLGVVPEEQAAPSCNRHGAGQQGSKASSSSVKHYDF